MCHWWPAMVPEDAIRTDETGLDLLTEEMSRQYGDARASYEAAGEAQRIARRIATQGRLVMLGMGASHWVNRMVTGAYRRCGINAIAEVLSEHLRALPPTNRQVTLLVSQSGETGEVATYFDRVDDRRDHFGLTMGTESLLARSLPSLSGTGGHEKPFAATRSIIITLALHAAILAHLGYDTTSFLDVLTEEPDCPGSADVVAASLLAAGSCVFLGSRGAVHSVLEATALTYMELARTPALALEVGQLRHGPIESLSSETALILARPAGGDAASVAALAEKAVGFGVKPIIFDLGDHPPVEGAVTHTLPKLTGLAACARLLPAAQTLAIDAAVLRVADPGIPHRATKVTNGEAA